ncbi:MAG: hypothetical protein ABW097_08790 [Candidatus Thiodiazotropha lotti]
MRTDNQFKRKGLESKLSALLSEAAKNGTLQVANGQISRSWIVSEIGCGQNWCSQNKFAKNLIAKHEQELVSQGGISSSRPVPGRKDEEVRLLVARVNRLESRNAQLQEEVNRFRQAAKESGWLDENTVESSQGRLPW